MEKIEKQLKTTKTIKSILVYANEYGELVHKVGAVGVTEITKVSLAGPYNYVPYLKVWKGDILLAEFCQHNVVGVHYET